MQSRLLKRLLLSSALISLARADYYIDDQNYTSLLYSENPGGAKWGPFQEGGVSLSISLSNGTLMSVNASQCFNYTYTYAACTVADDCQVQIPFTGSGITIYVLQAGAQGINASLTIDGGAPAYSVLPAPAGPNFYTPNVTLFNVHGMATGDHTATMTVLDWDNNFSGMMFDYALINQTIVSSTTSSVTPSSSSTSTVTSAPSSSKSAANVGAIVGGTVGGLAVLSAIIFAVFYLRRRHYPPQRLSVNLDAEPKVEPFFMADSLYHQPDAASRYTDIPGPRTESLVTGPASTYVPPQATNSSSSRREKSQLGIMNPNAVQITDANVTPSAQASSHTPDVSTRSPSPTQIRQTHPTLSDGQADFVNNLYVNNVPAAAIARVIERMMAGEQQPVVDGYESLPPPSYYHVANDD